MDAIDLLKDLSSQMSLEPAEDAGCTQVKAGQKPDDIFISRAMIPGGKQIKLLKTLQTSACERNCYYCPFRAGRDFRRATFKPDEMAKTFISLNRAGLAEGLFLSSGIAGGGIRTQDQLIATAEILRKKMGFQGYLHLKIMPGAEKAQVERTMQLADRVSINLEAPNTRRLLALAPRKEFMEELLEPLKWVEEIRRNQPGFQGWKGYWPSTTTQFVVGAAGESDLELLQTTEFLYQQLRLKRAYYSAFSPVQDTPLENLPPTPAIREFRLYQSSFLLRDYGFSVEELPFTGDGTLPLDRDPKIAWAQVNLAEKPIDINHANRQELIRVPGIGPIGADRLLAARRQANRPRVHDLSDLRAIGINPGRAAPYILIDGRRPEFQMKLF